MHTLAARWFHHFGNGTVNIRQVLDVALDEDVDLLAALAEFDPEIYVSPQPGRLTRILRNIENLPQNGPDEAVFRFRRLGNDQWRLLPCPQDSRHKQQEEPPISQHA